MVMKILRFTDNTELHWNPTAFSPEFHSMLAVSTKSEIVDLLKTLDLPKNSYWIQHSRTGIKIELPGLAKPEGEKSGLSVDYYKVQIQNPTTPGLDPYTAECNDLIESLQLTYAEANVFKAIWRSAAARTLGKKKAGNDALYDAEKMVFFSGRVLSQVQFQQKETK